MEAERQHEGVLEPAPENSGLGCTLENSSSEYSRRNTAALHNFAQATAEKILLSLINQLGRRTQTEEDGVVRGYPDARETLAEQLTIATITSALREAYGRCGTVEDLNDPQGEPRGSVFPCHAHGEVQMKTDDTQTGKVSFQLRERGEVEQEDEDIDYDDDRGPSPCHLSSEDPVSCSATHQASGTAQRNGPFLSQSGLPVVGSLDYPDAPPTTPLLPELLRSRDSFARKLKGGLAKEFLPSPPPPTPKEEEDGTEARAEVVDPKVELLEHMMRSLTAEYAEELAGGELPSGLVVDGYGGENTEKGLWDRIKVVAYAEALSEDIIDWVTDCYPVMIKAGIREQLKDDSDLHLLAGRLAETIISSTLSDVKEMVVHS